jgi:hypothetical protein
VVGVALVISFTARRLPSLAEAPAGLSEETEQDEIEDAMSELIGA